MECIFSAELTHFWNFKLGTFDDKVGNGADLSPSSSINLAYDRNNVYAGALSLNKGYAVIPSDIYFNSEFSIAVWVKPVNTYATDSWSRIVEFGRGVTSDNIILMFNDDRDGHFYLNFYLFIYFIYLKF